MNDEFEYHNVISKVLEAPKHSIAAAIADEDLDSVGRGSPQLSSSRLRAGRSWLYALGYLSDDRDVDGYDSDLIEAVKGFQRDSEINVDGWIGTAETWPRLQELAAFDGTPNRSFWETANGSPKPALLRAVAARLFVYGFNVPRLLENTSDLLSRLTEFENLMSAMHANPLRSQPTNVMRCIQLLNHQQHISALSVSLKKRAVTAIFESTSARSLARRCLRLLNNLSKCELWLSQSPSIDLRHQFRGRVTHEGPVVPRKLRSAVATYFGEVHVRNNGIKRLQISYNRARNTSNAIGVIRAFFAVSNFYTGSDYQVGFEDIVLINRFYNPTSETESLRNTARMQEIGDLRAKETQKELSSRDRPRARLWDGVKRVLSWIGRTLRNIVGRALSVARRIARFVFTITSSAYKGFKRAVENFASFYSIATRKMNIEREAKNSNVRIVHIRHFGRDAELVIDASINPEIATYFTNKLSISAKIFKYSCRIVGRLLSFFVRIGISTVSPALILKSLIWLIRNAREFFRDSSMISKLRLELFKNNDRLRQLGSDFASA